MAGASWRGASWRRRPMAASWASWRGRILCTDADLPAGAQPHAPCSTSARSSHSATANAWCSPSFLRIDLHVELDAIAPMASGFQAPTAPLSPSTCPQAIASQPEQNSCFLRKGNSKSLSGIVITKSFYPSIHAGNKMHVCLNVALVALESYG